MGERFGRLGLEFGVEGGKRERVLHVVVVVEIAFAGRSLAGFAVLAVGTLGRSLERGGPGGRGRRPGRLRQHTGPGTGRRPPPRNHRLPLRTHHPPLPRPPPLAPPTLFSPAI